MICIDFICKWPVQDKYLQRKKLLHAYLFLEIQARYLVSQCKENAGVAHIIMDYLLHTYYDWFTVHVLYSPLICFTEEYVTCHTCRSPDTLLQKDTRIFFLQCESCGSRCSVTSIKSGFQAVTGKRAAIRAKTA